MERDLEGPLIQSAPVNDNNLVISNAAHHWSPLIRNNWEIEGYFPIIHRGKNLVSLAPMTLHHRNQLPWFNKFKLFRPVDCSFNRAIERPFIFILRRLTVSVAPSLGSNQPWCCPKTLSKYNLKRKIIFKIISLSLSLSKILIKNCSRHGRRKDECEGKINERETRKLLLFELKLNGKI